MSCKDVRCGCGGQANPAGSNRRLQDVRCGWFILWLRLCFQSHLALSRMKHRYQPSSRERSVQRAAKAHTTTLYLNHSTPQRSQQLKTFLPTQIARSRLPQHITGAKVLAHNLLIIQVRFVGFGPGPDACIKIIDFQR